MENYSFWQDFFATYRSSPDAIKALWIVAPLAFMIALVWIVARLSACKRKIENDFLPVFENSAQNRSERQVLVFARGRLLNRLEAPNETDGRRTAAEM